MTAQTEFLWRLATEVQKADDRAASSPAGSRERFVAEQMRELYQQIEQLPAHHSLFQRCRGTPGLFALDPDTPRLLLVRTEDSSAESEVSPRTA